MMGWWSRLGGCSWTPSSPKSSSSRRARSTPAGHRGHPWGANADLDAVGITIAAPFEEGRTDVALSVNDVDTGATLALMNYYASQQD